MTYSDGDGKLGDSSAEVSLISVHPYASWVVIPTTLLWEQLGYGSGELKVTDSNGRVASDDDFKLSFVSADSLILLNLADKKRDAGICVVRMDDGLTVKRYDPRPKGALYMTSENPVHEPFTAKAAMMRSSEQYWLQLKSGSRRWRLFFSGLFLLWPWAC